VLSHGGSQLVLTWAANQCNLHFQYSPLEGWAECLAPGRDSTLLWVYGMQNRSLDKEGQTVEVKDWAAPTLVQPGLFARALHITEPDACTPPLN